MKTKLMILLLLAGSSLFAAPRVFVGLGVGMGGYYPAPAPVVAYAPPCPGPGYVWAAGYWAPGHYWHPGYWRAPYVRGYSVGPRYFGRYDRGYYRGNNWHRR
jgi:hypothetical protein